nr:hypothetical protein [Nocardia wallacei]
MSSFSSKYRFTVRGDTSAASAICSTVVASNPFASHNRSATSMMRRRVCCFLRSRRPAWAGRGDESSMARFYR